MEQREAGGRSGKRARGGPPGPTNKAGKQTSRAGPRWTRRQGWRAGVHGTGTGGRAHQPSGRRASQRTLPDSASTRGASSPPPPPTVAQRWALESRAYARGGDVACSHQPIGVGMYSQPGWLATEGVCPPINVRHPVHMRSSNLVKLDAACLTPRVAHERPHCFQVISIL